MKPFEESMRYEYNLTPDSWVVDVGAYQGSFSRRITLRYDCWVLGFEPIFWDKASEMQTNKVLMLPFAVGDLNTRATFGVGNDWTGKFLDGELQKPDVHVMDVLWLRVLLRRIDLLKLNIEGMEYEVLERILETGMQYEIENIQVQFHTNAPDYHNRRLSIMDKLADTHVLTYQYDYVWESWKRK